MFLSPAALLAIQGKQDLIGNLLDMYHHATEARNDGNMQAKPYSTLGRGLAITTL